MTIALSINLNKIALIRNSREGNYPQVQSFGKDCLDAGVQGLTVHPRPDQRHIRPSDVSELSSLIQGYPNAEFNIEGNPFAGPKGSYPGLLELVKAHHPHQCTLVPDSDSQLTSDHGFNLHKDSEKLRPIVQELQSMNVRVSLFMDPDREQIELAHALGVERIELYTGPYAQAYNPHSEHFASVHQRYQQAAATALELGLEINAGHDLNLQNMQSFKTIAGIKEVSIGHAFTVDALLMGYKQAINAYLAVCR